MSNCKLCLADCAFSGKDMKKGACKGYIPMTNADRIRAMSDDELAMFMDGSDCPPEEKCTESCYECWLSWLRQPAEEETTC